MRRYVRFAFIGMVAMWLVSFLPPAASTLATALVVGVGAAGGTLAQGGRDIISLALGALLGTAISGLTQGLGAGGPDTAEVINGSVTVAAVIAVAGTVSFFVTDARRPHPPPDKVGDDVDG